MNEYAKILSHHAAIKKSSPLSIDLPTDFPAKGVAEIIVLPLHQTHETVPALSMNNWLDRAWGCVPNFSDRPNALPFDDIQLP